MRAVSITIDDFIKAHLQHPGRKRKVRLVVVHATQSKERKGAARATAGWFADPAAKGSAHVTCDDAETIGSVHPQDTAAGAPGANEDGFHIEQVGYSEQGEPEWLDAYSEKVIARAARAAIEACDLFDIPKVWLSVQDVRDGKAGITDHDTITKATGKGTHWDPGPFWPRGRFMALVQQEDDDMAMTPEERRAFIGEIADEIDRRNVMRLQAEDTVDDTAEIRNRDSLASLIRRVLGVPAKDDQAEQHKADALVGERFKNLLGD